MNVLVLNSGSSSVKYELFDMDAAASVLEGEIERVGTERASEWFELRTGSSAGRRESAHVEAADHAQALDRVLARLASAEESGIAAPRAVGHRVVHGGERFDAPAIIDADVVRGIEQVAVLAPLHTGANLAGIAAARERLPDVPHVAVFDTAFHRTMPPEACEYALPRELCRAHHIRRYGFHGTSHAYVAHRAAEFLGKQADEVDLITLHLGAGASVAAIRAGRSIDTSMGMTPLEGLVMGTRCGDIDPALPMLLAELTGRSRVQVNALLNSESGLLGLCGASDMREVHRLAAAEESAGDPDGPATRALELFCYRAKKYVGAYFAVLGGADAVVFTAGIGEHDADVRARICEGLGLLGIEVDEERNAAPGDGERCISTPGSRVAVLVIPTDEEREIARQVLACLRDREQREDEQA